MASLSESDLLSKLESTTSTPLFSIFSDYLFPFLALRNPNKPQPQSQIQNLKRSLAKQFLTFLSRSLSIIPKRLSDPSKLGSEDSKLVFELFDTYRLCIDCLELVASELSCDMYKISFQRLSLIYRLEVWGMYKEAVDEGFRVLERLRDSEIGGKNTKKGDSGEFLPAVVGIKDKEFSKLVVEVVVNIVKCVALGQSKEGSDYRRVLSLVDGVKQYFRCVQFISHIVLLVLVEQEEYLKRVLF